MATTISSAALVPVTARVPPPAAAPPVAALKPAAPNPAPAPLLPATLHFAPGSADLPPGAAATLHAYCASPSTIAIDARAPSDPSDPSAAMRLSLARALAVQQALTSCGVPVQRILPRALGNVAGQDEDETIIGKAAK